MFLRFVCFLFFIPFIGNAQLPPLQWAKNMASPGSGTAYSLKEDANGNIYVTGYFNGTADFDPSPATINLVSNGNKDIYVAKFTASGNFIWAYGIGGSQDDIGSAIDVDASGNVYLTGFFRDTVDFDPSGATFSLVSQGSDDIFLLKITSNGNFVWAESVGGPGSDRGSTLQVDPSNNVIIAGSFLPGADFDPSPATYTFNNSGEGLFISKFNSSGGFVWTDAIYDSNPVYPSGMTIDSNGFIYLTGNFFGPMDFDPGVGTTSLITSPNYCDIFVLKLTASGGFKWAKQMGGTSFDYGRSIAADNAGNVYTTGSFMGSGDFDPGPGTCSLVSSSSTSAFFSKLDSLGNFVWGKHISSQSSGSIIRRNNSNKIISAGTFVGTADFDFGPGTYTYSSTGPYLLVMDTAANFIEVNSISGTTIKAISINSSDEFIGHGEFSGTVDFDMGVNTATLAASAGNLYIIKLSNSPASVGEISNQFFFGVFPNPGSDKVYISTNEQDFKKIKISIYNELGQIELNEILLDLQKSNYLEISALKNGIYFFHLSNRDKTVVKKVIINR